MITVFFKEWFLLTESAQQIANLGFPKVIAQMFQRKFERKAFVLAKWFKDASGKVDPSQTKASDWWELYSNPYGSKLNMRDWLNVYDALPNPKKYNDVMTKLGFELSPEAIDEEYLKIRKKEMFKQIEDKLFGDGFFTDEFIKEIIAGTETPQEYADMTFSQAQIKYDEKNIFEKKEPLKTFEDGMKWIDVGRTCVTIGKKMHNCGRVGAMSLDSTATLLVLFDKFKNPHVIATYQPKTNTITGLQGKASTLPKEEYDNYILDLFKHLGTQYEYHKSGAVIRIALKELLGNDAHTLEKLVDAENTKYFKFIKNGKTYYTNGNQVLTEKDIDKVIEETKNGSHQRLQNLPTDKNSVALYILQTPGLFRDIPFVGLPHIFRNNNSI